MKKVLIVLIIMFSFFSNAYSKYNKLVYDFDFNGIDGKKISLKDLKVKVKAKQKKISREPKHSTKEQPLKPLKTITDNKDDSSTSSS